MGVQSNEKEEQRQRSEKRSESSAYTVNEKMSLTMCGMLWRFTQLESKKLKVERDSQRGQRRHKVATSETRRKETKMTCSLVTQFSLLPTYSTLNYKQHRSMV